MEETKNSEEISVIYENKIRKFYEEIDDLSEEFFKEEKITERLKEFLDLHKDRNLLEDFLYYERQNKSNANYQKKPFYFSFLLSYEDDEKILYDENQFAFPDLSIESVYAHDRVKTSLKIKPIELNTLSTRGQPQHSSLNLNQAAYTEINREEINEFQNELKEILNLKDKTNKIVMEEVLKIVKDFSTMLFGFCFLIRFFGKLEIRFQILKNDKIDYLFVDLSADTKTFYEIGMKQGLNLQVKFFERSIETDRKNKKKDKKLKMKDEDLQTLDELGNDKPDFYTPHIQFNEQNEKYFMLYKLKNDKIHTCNNCFTCHKSYAQSMILANSLSNNSIVPNYNFECYNNDDLTILRHIDKERIILKSLKTFINIDKISQKSDQMKFFKKTFILHNYHHYEKKYFSVSNLYACFKNPTRTKEVNQINRQFRNFHGENVGFYFAWLSHYIEWLYIPMILFVIYYFVSVVLLILSQESIYVLYLSYIVSFFLSSFLMFWGNTYIQSWTANQEFINHSWGMDCYKMEDSDYSNQNINTLSYFDVNIPCESSFKKFLAKIISFAVTLFFITISIIVNMGIFYVEDLHFYAEKFVAMSPISKTGIGSTIDDMWLYLSPVIIYIVREILSFAFGYVLPFISRFEQHPSKKSKQNSIIMKSFFFQFFNYYFIFYYIAFFKKYYETCAYGDCYSELTITVRIILSLTILGDLFDLLILFYVKNKYDNIKENTEKKIEEQSHNPKFLRNHKYLFFIKNAYEGESINIEYITIIMNYGYIIQFGSISPLCFFLAMIQGMLSRIFDAIKFGNVIYIGFIDGSQGIDVFSRILKILTFFGFTSSILINLFTNTQYAQLDNTTKWILAFAFENLCVFVMFFWKLDLLPTWFYYKDKIKMNIENRIKNEQKKLKQN